MATRKQIRDAIKAALEVVYTDGPIYTSRLVDVRDDNSFVQVVLMQGGVVGEEGANPNPMRRADLIVAYSVKLMPQEDDEFALPTDDDLDVVMETLDQVISAKAFLRGTIAGVLFRNFEYVDDDEQEFTSLRYTYDLYY